MPGINPHLAHDMRAPLQLIFSCAQMIQTELDGTGQPAADYARMLMENVRALNGMIAHALNKGADPGNGCDIAARAKSLCGRFEIQAAQAGIRLSFSANVRALRANIDGEKLSRVLMNLISNALRFTPAGGRVDVRLTALNDLAELSVTDTGVGIPPEKLSRVFRPGETDGGHGLGLAIAREYARQMGGDISVVSAPGKGSAFTLRLPL